MYNILIGCDQAYFDDWGIALLESIQYHVPWISLHCHIVNPTQENILPNVTITEETIDFPTDEVKIAYLQAVRFLAVADKFINDEYVITLDADTICAREFSQEEFDELFKHQYVLHHPKDDRWLAGFVVFINNNFRQEYARQLRSLPLEEWEWGRDQLILNELIDDFAFRSLPKEWMAIGKNKSNRAFLTLKGDQKYSEKFLNIYLKYKIDKC